MLTRYPAQHVYKSDIEATYRRTRNRTASLVRRALGSYITPIRTLSGRNGMYDTNNTFDRT